MFEVERGCIVLLSKSPDETFRIGRMLSNGLHAGDVVALTGELGSGKTSLTQGIADGLGVTADYVITSPTFTLINEYPGRRMNLFHLDVYRLTGCNELSEMGYDECLSSGGVTVIEWAEKILKAVPINAILITMTYVDEYERKIEVFDHKDRIGLWQQILIEGGC